MNQNLLSRLEFVRRIKTFSALNLNGIIHLRKTQFRFLTFGIKQDLWKPCIIKVICQMHHDFMYQ